MDVAALVFERAPWLWLGLLAVPVVALHMYNRRRITVAFLPLFQEGVGTRRPGGGWRRIRDVLALAARLLALGALVLAIAGLRPAEAGPPPRSLVLVIDTDVTTRVREADGQTRLERALDLAAALVRSDAWARVGVLAAGAEPEVWIASEDDRERAAEMLEARREAVTAQSDEAYGGTADLAAATDAARAWAGREAPARVVVLSARPLEAAEGVEVLGTGSAHDDQGITAFAVGPGDEEGVHRVLVRVRNDADAAVTRTLVVSRDDESEEVELELAPGASEEAVLAVRAPEGGAWLRIRLDGNDVFAGNDAVSARLPAPLAPRILLVHGARTRPFTQAILEALAPTIDREGSARVPVEALARAPLLDVQIVDGVAVPEGALRPGAWIFLAPLAGDLPFTVGAPVEEPLVWRSAPDHPLVRDLDLATAYVARGQPLSGEGFEPLAEADGAAVLGEGERNGVRYVVLGLDPEGSDLPVRAALPLLVRNAVRRLAARPVAPLEPLYRAGEALRTRQEVPGGPSLTLELDGRTWDVTASPEGAVWTVPPGLRGEAILRSPAWEGRTALVDVDPERSVRPVRPPAARPAPAPAPPRDAGRRWREVLIAAALGLLLLDLLLQRGRS